ncbi:MAG: Zn-binding domain-containing protein, partial [Luteimonas sp.]
ASPALHWLATFASIANARDRQNSVGNVDVAWFATRGADGRGRAQDDEGKTVAVATAASIDGTFVDGGRFVPTVYLYDNFPGGVGLSEPLWQRQAELVHHARELVERCDCATGCPACVGPVLAADEDKVGSTPKGLALRVLALLAGSNT